MERKQIFAISEFFKGKFFVITAEQFEQKAVTKLTAQYCISFYIYTFQASFVPHLKIPRYHEKGFAHQKALMIQIISVPRHEIRYQNS